MNENVIGIVSFGTVDDDGLKIFVPSLGMAEKFAQVMFGFNSVLSETRDELIGMTKIIIKSSPDVLSELFLKFFHEFIPP